MDQRQTIPEFAESIWVGSRLSLRSSGLLAALVLACLIAMNEIDRLIGDVLAADGHTHTIAEVTGLGAGAATEAWADWRSATYSPDAFLLIHCAIDAIFIFLYVILGLRLINAVAGPALSSIATILLFSLAAFDTLQDVSIVAITLSPFDPGWIGPGFVVVASYAVWSTLAILVLYLLLSSATGGNVRDRVATLGRGLYAQRLSAIVVAAIALVSLVTADGVLEQVADIYRGWIVYGASTVGEPLTVVSLNWGALGLAAASFLVTGVGLFVLGRQRAQHYGFLGSGTRRKKARLRWWVAFVGAALLIVGAITLRYGLPAISWRTFGVFLLFVLGIVIASRVLRGFPRALPRPRSNPRLANNIEAVRDVGDWLVAVWILVWALGPFKAFLAPVLLNSATTEVADGSPTGVQLAAWLLVTFLLAGLLLFMVIRRLIAIYTPPVDTFEMSAPPTDLRARRLIAATVATKASATPAVGTRLGIGAWAVVLVAVALITAVLLAPMQIAFALGPIATIVILVGAWTALLGAIIIAHGRRLPLEVFRVLRLRATPFISLLVIVPLVISSVAGEPALHSIQFTASGTPTTRVTLEQALDTWYTRQTPCSIDVAGNQVVPLLLVAAQGGGIRAATWTADVMRQLPRDGSCAAGATLISSGASGGSIGLATFRAKDNQYRPSTMSTANLAGPGALAADLAALLAGDLVGALSGVRVPSSLGYDSIAAPAWAWRDRTAIQELTWGHDAEQFASAYNTRYQAPTGYLLLNSMDSVSNCKVVISQLDLELVEQPPPAEKAAVYEERTAATCSGADAVLSNTIDLQDYLGPCVYDLSWATAAELSARFPYVSPGGRLSNDTLPNVGAKKCNTVSDMQLIDGGVMENSALSSLADLTPRLVDLIEDTNALADGKTRPFVIPIVVYVENEPGFDVTAPADGTRPDILVPTAAQATGPAALASPSAWLTRLSQNLGAACPTGSDVCQKSLSVVRTAMVDGSVAVVYPSTGPALSVPLGWTLSSLTSESLGQEAFEQTKCRSVDVDTPDYCPAPRTYGMFGDVLDLMKDGT